MVRCDDFYCKYQRLRDLGPEELKAFCDKNPETIRRIDILLDDLIPLIKNEAAKSEILNLENTPIGGIVSEGALRPLMSEHDPEVRGKVASKIVEKAEEKTIDGENPRVTHREVAQIVREVRGEEPEPVVIPPKPTLAQETAFQDWAHDLQNKTCVGALPKVVVDLFDLQKVKDVLEMQTCPCCGSQTKATLVWSCCGGTIDDAIAAADGAVDQLIEPMKTIKREVTT